jgi:hypothetical protein
MITSCTNGTSPSLHFMCTGYLCGTSTLASTPHGDSPKQEVLKQYHYR